jgi:hypothetical protein
MVLAMMIVSVGLSIGSSRPGRQQVLRTPLATRSNCSPLQHPSDRRRPSHGPAQSIAAERGNGAAGTGSDRLHRLRWATNPHQAASLRRSNGLMKQCLQRRARPHRPDAKPAPRKRQQGSRRTGPVHGTRAGRPRNNADSVLGLELSCSMPGPLCAGGGCGFGVSRSGFRMRLGRSRSALTVGLDRLDAEASQFAVEGGSGDSEGLGRLDAITGGVV